MSRDKQIEEMMKVVHNAELDYFHTMVTGDIDDIIDGVASRDEIVATALYNAGYRKAEDVVREILAEVREFYMRDNRYTALERSVKKKYESEGAE